MMSKSQEIDERDITLSPALCRACLHAFNISNTHAPQCPQCQRGQIVSHPELNSLSVAHIDCDAFYASIEKRDNPELASKPLIIGGQHRGVVSTACYIARMNGVRSAMPMYKAKKLCPDAVILPARMSVYRDVGMEIRRKFRDLTPLVEPLSIDEAFLDLTGTERLHGHAPASMLNKLASDIFEEIGVTVSIGLAPNKFLAKLASDMNKPRGFTVIGNADYMDILAELPITKIYGIGKKTSARLAKDGLSHIHQLQEMDEATLIRRYGEIGQRLYRLSRGQDKRKVTVSGEAKSVSGERTFSHDLADKTSLENKLWSISEGVAKDLKRKNLAGATITLKLKNSMHRIITRSRTLSAPTQLAETIFEQACELLAPLIDGTPYRLIGVGVKNFRPLEEADLPNLLEPKQTKRANAERAMDSLKAKFGDKSIGKGRGIKPKTE